MLRNVWLTVLKLLGLVSVRKLINYFKSFSSMTGFPSLLTDCSVYKNVYNKLSYIEMVVIVHQDFVVIVTGILWEKLLCSAREMYKYVTV